MKTWMRKLFIAVPATGGAATAVGGACLGLNVATAVARGLVVGFVVHMVIGLFARVLGAPQSRGESAVDRTDGGAHSN